MILRLLTISILLQSCAPTQVLVSPPPFEVERSLWVKCWEACGKADKLKAVNPAWCVCTNGTRFQHQAEPIKVELIEEY